MQTCKYTDFGLCVKTELLKRGWEQKHLEELVSKDSGLYIDAAPGRQPCGEHERGA